MSSNIWTQCGAKSNVKRLTVTARRVVEGQHRISTRQLVDSDDEHETLEQILEATKPPTDVSGLHYLLATPFRYPPLRHGSRFGRRHERSLWYGSKTLKTVFAEKAYYEFYFVSGSSAVLTPLRKDLTTYATTLRSRHSVDLTQGRFAAERDAIASPVSYTATHVLGTAMRDDAEILIKISPTVLVI